MSAGGKGTGPTRRRGLVKATSVTMVVLVSSSCGLPSDGSVHTIDEDAVPYRLLESGPPSESASATQSEPAKAPVVFWVARDRLVPEATEDVCAERPEALVERLLSTLAAGPPEDERAAGRSSALPPDSGLELVGFKSGTVEVDIEQETSLSAERLPFAVGQVVLTVTSAPTVRSVILTTDGEPVQVPLPQGALTDGPVTARDYAALLPDRFTAPGAFGCPLP
jgi:spore germination protein GerM